MGSCVSVNKDPESAMKLRFGFRSKNSKLIIPSPVKEAKPLEVADDDGPVKSQWSNPPPVTVSRDFGSKEESFFDSQAWFESDCEDDFFSVNGDFTPSRGNTPVHHNFTAANSRHNGSPFVGRRSNDTPELSPSEKKKKLSDLFKESQGDDKDVQEQNAVGIQKGSNTNTVTTVLKSENGTPFVSGANSMCSSSERSPNPVMKPSGEKSLKPGQCCLPRLLSSRSFSERKKRTTSPALSVGA
ncbi:hypothetical protein M9H77_37114 [Catharanthus roseus]|uniref:Uncharacterized protein n=1 Tax=Catharanthus roseus TaxID=4058 RepID=A0ACB9ZTR2_CATRO|nr:hypothetical protein M9H77_37114 [Catharanthus roseus]